MLRHSSSSSSPIYTALARAPHQAQQQKQPPCSSCVQKDNAAPHVLVVVDFVCPHGTVRESQGGGEEAALGVPGRGAGRHRQAQHRQERAPEPGPVPPARRVLSVQARRVPRPPPPRIRDRHLHARRRLHPPGLLGTQGHHQNWRCAVDDGRPRHRALGDAGVRRRAEGPAALDQPCLQGQDDRAPVPGAAEQGHKHRRKRRRRGQNHRRGSLWGAVTGVYADADHVHGLHDAAQVAAPPANPGGVERLRVHHRGGGRVRPRESSTRNRTPLPRARHRRGQAQRMEPVRRAAAVRAGGRAAAQGARGAAGALRDEHTRRDLAGNGGLLLRPQRLREGQPVELRLNLIDRLLLLGAMMKMMQLH